MSAVESGELELAVVQPGNAPDRAARKTGSNPRPHALTARIEADAYPGLGAAAPIMTVLAPAVQVAHSAAPVQPLATPHSFAIEHHLPSMRLRTFVWQTFKCSAPLLAADLVALLMCGLLSAILVWPLYSHVLAIAQPMAVILGLVLLAYWICGLYSAMGVSPVLELKQIIQINSIAFVAAAVGGAVSPPIPLWCLGCCVLACGLVPFWRANARRWCCQTTWWGRPTLVITSGKSADSVVLSLLRAPTSGFRPIAVTDPQGEARSALVPVINDHNELKNLVEKHSIRYAVVSAPDASSAGLGDLFNRYAGMIPHIIVLSDSPDLPSLWGTSRSCGRMTGVEMRNARMLARLWYIKRIIDVVVAIIALVMSFPLLVLIALAVKLTSKGPIFFGHSRIGLGGHWFMAWKFRTMHPDGDAVLRAYLEAHPEAKEEWERDHKLKNDPRVTPIGDVLRRLSLDELPQIWNVIKGEMSLVGPRPIVAKEVIKYGGVFKKYSTVKPGITGMWQVSGRSEVSYEERVQLDEFYVANWSPWLDLYILAKTVVVLLRRKGAY